ncbi:hypothetical protein PBI_SMARTIES_34 [Microbacterium phage Smarties]|uniref:Uncharacterized protein n=1 Tax=Microbacterium phage Ariadne TaxID=2656546 RepID=A0A649VAQ1_9CAUD|nr:hypothetical protein QDA10_gp034 [Microbacterium phage Ariadne]QGJ89438.1 hypothetical protein PBI_ARIADNE_34 [Microbacterium phage Ariadne]QGJ91425.1 hypothetical protein PBI_SMARTIES_34 [Microbacterium phage Smarties]
MIMGCACNKGKTANGLAAKRAESPADQKARESREAASNQRASGIPSPSAGTRSTPVMHGRTQSFALESGGKTARFGSRLERDAAKARISGQ